MENPADGSTRQLSKLCTSKKPLYTLYLVSIFIFIFLFTSLHLPFLFRSYLRCRLTLTSFLDNNDRHYIFLLCNVILFILFMNSGSTRTSQTWSERSPTVSTGYANRLPEPIAVEEETKTKRIVHVEILVGRVDDRNARLTTQDQTEHPITDQVLIAHDEHEAVATVDVEEEIKTKQILHDEILVGHVDHHNAYLTTQDWIEDPETDQVHIVRDELEAVASVEEAEEEHDKEAADELKKKCEEFIEKMRQRIKHESSS